MPGSIDPSKSTQVAQALYGAADGPADEQRSLIGAPLEDSSLASLPRASHPRFTTVDHLAVADRQLDDVRAPFAVPPREC